MRGKRSMQVRQWGIVAVLLLVAVWLTAQIWGLVGKTEIAVSQAQRARRQYDALESRQTALEQNLAELATPLGQDAAIRTAFSVAKKGEEVIVVVPPAVAPTSTPQSWWRRVFSWF